MIYSEQNGNAQQQEGTTGQNSKYALALFANF